MSDNAPLDLAVIILTKNEEIHLQRALDNVSGIAKEIFVIDSLSTDCTPEIARSNPKVTLMQNPWPGSQAVQFNWALDNAPLTAGWILRLDADEYLTPELIDELRQRLPLIPGDVVGLTLKRRHIFMGKWIKRGVYPVKLLRIFRRGRGRSEQRLMDEHITVTGGVTQEMRHDFCDHNLGSLSYFCHKHVDYAVREAASLLDKELGLSDTTSDSSGTMSSQAAKKRRLKNRYGRLPLFWRSTAYFLYRYILKGAFLEGKEGFIFTFIQGWWYRTLVDAKVFEIKKECGNDPEAIRRHLAERYGITIPTNEKD